jgi:threonyl-tRNA synthetase
MKQENIEYLEKMRHSASHILAQAVLKLYPDTKLGIGPVIDNGFYYDFEFSEPIDESNLKEIEAEIRR